MMNDAFAPRAAALAGELLLWTATRMPITKERTIWDIVPPKGIPDLYRSLLLTTERN